LSELSFSVLPSQSSFPLHFLPVDLFELLSSLNSSKVGDSCSFFIFDRVFVIIVKGGG
jgi:hypothetical protein